LFSVRCKTDNKFFSNFVAGITRSKIIDQQPQRQQLASISEFLHPGASSVYSVHLGFGEFSSPPFPSPLSSVPTKRSLTSLYDLAAVGVMGIVRFFGEGGIPLGGMGIVRFLGRFPPQKKRCPE